MKGLKIDGTHVTWCILKCTHLLNIFSYKSSNMISGAKEEIPAQWGDLEW